MKHNYKVTLIMVTLFFVSQIIGLLVINQYIDHKVLAETGKVSFEELPGGIERPQVNGNELLLMLVFSILFGTILLLVLAKFRRVNMWKTWYTFSVTATLFFALGKFIQIFFGEKIAVIITLALSLGLALWKIFKPNIYIHNLTEVFIYAGLAAIFVPIPAFSVVVALILLAIISVYDMYAVWKSKHMVSLAEFTAESKVFAGLLIPYEKSSGQINSTPAKGLKVTSKEKVKNAILGGGDIGFPLLFAGVVMKGLMQTNPLWIGFSKALIIPFFTTIALYILLIKGEKNKFYPAMPFLTAGCLVGYGALLVVNLIH